MLRLTASSKSVPPVDMFGGKGGPGALFWLNDDTLWMKVKPEWWGRERCSSGGRTLPYTLSDASAFDIAIGEFSIPPLIMSECLTSGYVGVFAPYKDEQRMSAQAPHP
jgi:hypothetical protein